MVRVFQNEALDEVDDSRFESGQLESCGLAKLGLISASAKHFGDRAIVEFYSLFEGGSQLEIKKRENKDFLIPIHVGIFL